MSIDSAHKSKWAIAEIVFGVPLLVSLVIQSVVPLPISQGIIRLILILLGIVFIIAGLWIIISGRREFARFDQPTDPGHPTSRIVRTGVFAVSRNPLYLGCFLFFLGVALLLNNLWTVMTLLISIIICHYVLIVPEEQYLGAKFGAEYREYLASVHRWLGKK